MKYILMMNTPHGGPYQIANWPKKDFQAHIAFMKSFDKKLRESGELVGAEGLAPVTGSWTSRAPSAPTRSPRRRRPRPDPAARRSTWRSKCGR